MKSKKITAFAAALCMVLQMFPAGAAGAAENDAKNEIIYGDINGDGTPDITDLSMLGQYLLKDITLEGAKLKAADTDGDTEVDLRDLAHMKRFLTRQVTKLGPQEETSLKLKKAETYEDIFTLIENDDYYLSEDMINAVPDAVVKPAESVPTTSATQAPGSAAADRNYSETWNQEENVLEADIVKTDGKGIYSFTFTESGSRVPSLSIVYPDNGKFEKVQKIKADPGECGPGRVNGVTLRDMYLYNDMIIVIGNVQISNPETEPADNIINRWYYRNSKSFTFVSAYKKGNAEKEPELIDTYFQEGAYKDVRITPEGYMYVVTNGGFRDYRYYLDMIPEVSVQADKDDKKSEYNEEAVKKTVPLTGMSGNVVPVPTDHIYVPCDTDDTYSCGYTVVSGINLNKTGSISVSDTSVISGYTGEMYCSENNMYFTHERYSYRYFYNGTDGNDDEMSYDVTEITKVALSGGRIVPDASGEVPGYVLNQFSMSEYDGYFRIVTTANYRIPEKKDGKVTGHSRERSNNVYVLDLNLKKVGEITHFAKDESVKSVSFDGKTGYVVTYVQTDPLFAVDFSDPSAPVILDEYKIEGYSTYMQKWDDGHLIGFGKSADKDGRETGYKAVMFDNSDPENLKEAGIFSFLYRDSELAEKLVGKPENNEFDFDSVYLSSGGVYDRKQLLIAPEKNLIGFPLTGYASRKNGNYYGGFGYCFLSYDDGEFTLKNVVSYAGSNNDYLNQFNRAVYIGDYVYMISQGRLMAADMETCTKTDELELLSFDNSVKPE